MMSNSSSPPSSHQRQPPERQGNNEHDQAVISTADDAILAKLSCVEKGYYDDPFIRAMSQCASGLVHKSSSSTTSSIRSSNNISGSRLGHRHNPRAAAPSSSSSSATEPIIRKGTHARVKAVERAIDAFLSLPLSSDGVVRQVVILGAGRDTTYLRKRFGNNDNSTKLDEKNARWYEVDHPSVIQQKAKSWLPSCTPDGYSYNCKLNEDTGNSYSIRFEPKKGENAGGGKQIIASNYHLVGHDLRANPAALFELLAHSQHGYDPSMPTLFVLECVMMYLPEESTWDLLRYLANISSLSSEKPSSSNPSDSFVAVAIYDPIPSNDRFGQLMIENLRRAGIAGRTKGQRRSGVGDDDNQQSQQLSLEKTQTLSDQLTKLTQSGFHVAAGCDMMNAYDHGIISMDDRRRAARCEMLDELEEFVLLMKHYCLLVGVCSNGANREEGSSVSEQETCVGFQLCSIGKDSSMGFQEGRCSIVHR